MYAIVCKIPDITHVIGTICLLFMWVFILVSYSDSYSWRHWF